MNNTAINMNMKADYDEHKAYFNLSPLMKLGWVEDESLTNRVNLYGKVEDGKEKDYSTLEFLFKEINSLSDLSVPLIPFTSGIRVPIYRESSGEIVGYIVDGIYTFGQGPGEIIDLQGKVIGEPDVVKKIIKIFDSYSITPAAPIPGVYPINIKEYYIDHINDISSNTHRKSTRDFEYLHDELYPQVNIKDLVRSYMESKESVLLLVGKPGVGKTCLIKKVLFETAMFEHNSQSAIYVKDPAILKKEWFWADLAANPPKYLILDDLDSELVPRGSTDKKTIVNNLLSFSDGLFQVRTKVIITTNLTDEGIDKAIIRPGRCFDVLSFDHMKRSEALYAWKKCYELSDQQFAECFEGMEKISQAYLASEAERIKSESNKNYLIDPTCSVREQYARMDFRESIIDAAGKEESQEATLEESEKDLAPTSTQVIVDGDIEAEVEAKDFFDESEEEEL